MIMKALYLRACKTSGGQMPSALHTGALTTPICRSPFSERLFSPTYQSQKPPFFATSKKSTILGHIVLCAKSRTLGRRRNVPSSLFYLYKVLSRARILASSCEAVALSDGFEVCSPSLLHHALASVASAYCSDDLAIVSTLVHQRIHT